MSRPKTTDDSIDIGISAADRKKISRGLSVLLADSYTLYLMTHNFHWNVTGPQFNSLHVMFIAQYTEQWNALDIIAERIRALGHPAPGTYKEFVKLASIKEVDGVPEATKMVRYLVAAQRPRRARPAVSSPWWKRRTTSQRPICSRNVSRCMRRRPGCCAACSRRDDAAWRHVSR